MFSVPIPDRVVDGTLIVVSDIVSHVVERGPPRRYVVYLVCPVHRWMGWEPQGGVFPYRFDMSVQWSLVAKVSFGRL